MASKTKPEMSQSEGLAYGEELRIGSSGVPLALAPDLYRTVVINRQPVKRTARTMGLSADVAMRMVMLMRRHGVPSTDRLILLSVGYPDRTYAEIAAAFRVTVDHVNDCVLRMSSIRRAEPLSTELWEDITETTMSRDEIARRAAEVRRWHELDKREVPGRAVGRPLRRANMGGCGPDQRGCCGARQKACSAEP